MTDEHMKETMERTRGALLQHLEDLVDEIDGNGGRISSRKVLCGIHDSLDSLWHLDSLAGKAKS